MDRDFIAIQIGLQLGLISPDQAKTITAQPAPALIVGSDEPDADTDPPSEPPDSRQRRPAAVERPARLASPPPVTGRPDRLREAQARPYGPVPKIDEGGSDPTDDGSPPRRGNKPGAKPPRGSPTLPPVWGRDERLDTPLPRGSALAVAARAPESEAPGPPPASTAPPTPLRPIPVEGSAPGSPERPSQPCGTADTAVITQRLLAELRLVADKVLEVGGGDAALAAELLRGDPGLARRMAAAVACSPGVEDLSTIVAITECTEELVAGDLHVTPEQPGRYMAPEADAMELGRGGIGRVLLVRDRHLGRDIAMKELLRKPRFDHQTADAAKDALYRFLREARITGQLEHPNIVPVHEVGQRADGTLYYTMKLVRGRTFSEVLGGCKSLDERLKLLPRYLDLCQAIAYAHSRGVIHRDIKPQNVMLGEFGETLVLDWGLAKVAGQAEAPAGDATDPTLEAPVTGVDTGTVMGTTMGTPAYMSPEQAAGAVNELDARSDVWSLGAVLYELLTGRLPFGGASLQSILHKVVTQDPEPVRAIDPEIPPDLASVCDKALQRRRAARYASASELAAEIESYLAGRRVQAHEYSSWQLLKRLVSRNRVASSLAGSILALIIVSSIVILAAYREAEVNRAQAVTEKVEANRQRDLAEKSRDAEQTARELAQKRETEANLNLSIALEEEATRLARAREFLSAGIFASAALFYSPHNPASPHGSRTFGTALPDEAGTERLASLQSLLFEVATESIAKLERTLPGHGDAVSTVVFLPAGDYLLSSSLDGYLRWWRVLDGTLAREVKAHDGWIQGMALSQDGTVIATAGTDDTVALWDAASGSILRRSPRLPERQRSVGFARDGRLLVGGGRDGNVTVWQLPALTPIGTASVQSGEIRSIEWIPDRDAVIVAGTDKEIRIVSLVPPFPILSSLAGHSDITYFASLSSDHKKAVSASHDGTVRIWNLDRPDSPITLVGHKGHVVCSVFSPDGKLVASASHDRRISLWNAEDGTLLNTIDAHASALRGVVFSPDSSRLASSGEDRTVRIWRISPPQARTIRTAHGKAVYRIAYRFDGRALAAASLDGGVSIWNPDSGEPLASWTISGKMIWSIRFSPDGRRLLTTTNDGFLYSQNPADGTTLWSSRHSQGRLHSVVPFPDGRRVAIAGEGTLRILDALDGKTLIDLNGSGRYFWSADVSPDSSLLATGEENHRIVLWDTATGNPLKELSGHSDWVTWVEFSADGKFLLSSSKDSTIRLWDVASGRPLFTITGHEAWVNLARFSADGRYILSGSDDSTVRLWDAGTGRLLQSQKLDREESGAAFAPDGRHYAYADGFDIRISPLRLDLWREAPDTLLRTAQEAQGKQLVGFELLPLGK